MVGNSIFPTWSHISISFRFVMCVLRLVLDSLTDLYPVEGVAFLKKLSPISPYDNFPLSNALFF